jgi:hypothetical protein
MGAIHLLVLQMKFTRSEFLWSLTSQTEEEAGKRFLPKNCMSWNVRHLTWQEQRYFLYYG